MHPIARIEHYYQPECRMKFQMFQKMCLHRVVRQSAMTALVDRPGADQTERIEDYFHSEVVGFRY